MTGDEMLADDAPADALAALETTLTIALEDVRTAMHLGQSMNGRVLCLASGSLRSLRDALVEAIEAEDRGFAEVLAELHADDKETRDDS